MPANSRPIAATQWLFLKLLGAIYFTAFVSFGVQADGLIGSSGILPIGGFLNAVAQAYGAGRYWIVPTVFWAASTNLALKLVWIGGAVSSLLVVFGLAQRVALICCYLLYLSITSVGQVFLSFQWDALLLEAGFLAIFFGFSPLVIWLFRWLLFRLIFLSGAVKLLSGDTAWRKLTALTFHYQTQPLPTPIAWYMQQLPFWFQQASVLILFFIELVVPLMIFGPRRLRMFAAFWLVFLQILILLTGNYTFFNLLTISLCLFLLDDVTISRIFPVQRIRATSAPRFGPPAAMVVAVVILTISGLQLIGTFLGAVPSPAESLLRLIAPLEIVNTYGLFAVMTTSRPEIVVEGSNDGITWLEYEFKYKPGNLYRAPRWVAPHQPRLDWQMWFAALGDYRTNPWLVNFVARLLEGSSDVLRLLKRNPFPDSPPRFIRGQLYNYAFTDFQTRHQKGAWWKREPRGLYLRAISLSDVSRPGI